LYGVVGEGGIGWLVELVNDTFVIAVYLYGASGVEKAWVVNDILVKKCQ